MGDSRSCFVNGVTCIKCSKPYLGSCCAYCDLIPLCLETYQQKTSSYVTQSEMQLVCSHIVGNINPSIETECGCHYKTCLYCFIPIGPDKEKDAELIRYWSEVMEGKRITRNSPPHKNHTMLSLSTHNSACLMFMDNIDRGNHTIPRGSILLLSLNSKRNAYSIQLKKWNDPEAYQTNVNNNDLVLMSYMRDYVKRYGKYG